MLINPRLTDHYGISTPQAFLDFAIPFFDEDIPLYVDPFLLWKSPSQQDRAFHTSLINAFNHLGHLTKSGRREEAAKALIIASECDEVGLGSSAKRKGKRIGQAKADEVLALFETVPLYNQRGFRHFEELQFYVDGISRDRISDIACSFLKSFLIDYTQDQCRALGIPMSSHDGIQVYSDRNYEFRVENGVELPANPGTGIPILVVPKRWLRFVPWISYDDYFKSHCPQDDIAHEGEELTRVKVLNFNRANYGVVDAYVKEKERTAQDCQTDPLFTQIPIVSARRKLAELRKLPTGKDGNADKKYEDVMCQLLPSMLYPYLDFAAAQSRTDSGVTIRDLIMYNGQQDPFLRGLFDDYQSRQIVFEMKNVAEVGREHIDQLNRYLTDGLGKFGVLVTRTPLKKARLQSTIDLWSGQRRSIVTLTDADVEQMVEVFESKQRSPLDVLKRSYVEFRRKCPG